MVWVSSECPQRHLDMMIVKPWLSNLSLDLGDLGRCLGTSPLCGKMNFQHKNRKKHSYETLPSALPSYPQERPRYLAWWLYTTRRVMVVDVVGSPDGRPRVLETLQASLVAIGDSGQIMLVGSQCRAHSPWVR